ncbi:unnamed protein product [Colletotrichum noveboracense]|uniref:Uncharacterized protein n=1 Tax=Colletotrichum noveboracense TaxID=2664923 RepID=A0A9W4RLJ5_9PEZI|nr:unnamed protein product [Colletotrichum noveboracense]
MARRPHAPGFASKSVLYGTGHCSACGMWSEGPHQIDPGSWVRRSFRAAFAQASLRPCVLPWRDDGFCHLPMAAAFTPFEGDHHLRPEAAISPGMAEHLNRPDGALLFQRLRFFLTLSTRFGPSELSYQDLRTEKWQLSRPVQPQIERNERNR